ncbi:MAG: glycosyltransferase family 1 protein [Caldilinea sp. CFX5]|nr:glycosyltransferase family 1 protein [Caldilinea sp. CFX5]
MILGIFPEQGGSIANLGRTGQDTRFIQAYLTEYARHFAKVYYFSYANEQPALPANCYVVPNPGYHRWSYTFGLPLVQRRYIAECDVFRVMQAYGSIPAQLSKVFYGKPYIVTYGYRYFDNVRKEEPWLRAVVMAQRAKLGAQMADRVIVTTPEMGDYVAAFTPREKLLLVPNGVDTTTFRPAEAKAKNATPTLIHVGRLSPEKNLRMLIDALALIPAQQARLVLVGSGPQRDELAAYAAQKGITVEFTGVLPHEQLPAVLQQADLFVLPSLSEGHPKALLEAMSCGLPCVGANVPGVRDVITDGDNGLLCALTPADMAEKITQVLTTPELAQRLGAQARRYIINDYQIDKLVQREIAAMQALVTRKQQRDR